MPDARDIIDISAQAMYTQDAQNSIMSGWSWDDLDDAARDDWRRIAEAGIAALRDAGMLPTTRTQWGVHGQHNTVTIYIDEATAREQAKLLRDAGHPARLLRRTITCLDIVQTTGWEPIPDDTDTFVDQVITEASRDIDHALNQVTTTEGGN